MELITSINNPKIKNLQKLYAKSKTRREQELFVFEGARELKLALEGGYVFEQIFVVPDLFAKSDYKDVLNDIPSHIMYELSPGLFEKLAYREGSDGIISVAKPHNKGLLDLQLGDNPFVIVLEAVEKPGNLGAILRTADAASVDAVIICDPSTDLYNPNTIRSSVGCLFTVQTAVCNSQEAYTFLNEKNIATYAAELNTEFGYQDIDYTKASAIVMGTEADGLSPFWIQHATQSIKIPMRGVIDSLNVSVSTAIITFEAMRQRGF